MQYATSASSHDLTKNKIFKPWPVMLLVRINNLLQ